MVTGTQETDQPQHTEQNPFAPPSADPPKQLGVGTSIPERADGAAHVDRRMPRLLAGIASSSASGP